ncbi:MAG: hypothetical protein EOO46_09295 [Flavobacterium sp.]|nr:MAG: hypothetical protein EOO46_09295 [Flavobacterium sp.]
MNITTSYRIKAKASKAKPNLLYLYIEVKVHNNGVLDDTITVSTEIGVQKDKWDKDRAKGRDIEAQMINEKVTDFKAKTQDLLNELKAKRIEGIQEYKAEINNNLKLRLTGKVQRGKVQEQISKLKTYTFEYVLNHKLDNEELSVDRKRQYRLILDHMNRHFKNNIPTMDALSENDMLGIKQYFIKRNLKHNTLVTRLAYVSAVVKHAIKLKIIQVSPIPPKYVAAFVDGEREVLNEEECLKFIGLDDDKLSQTKKVAKYCFIIQLLTGIGYGDLNDIQFENIKGNEHGSFIEKKRNKTGKPFKVYLYESEQYLQKLIELTGDETKPINLPSIDYTNRLYKGFAKDLKINKVVTTYTLRHSFAVYWMNKGGRLEDLQKMLGHTKLSTTGIYGKISDQRLSEQMKLHQSRSILHQLPKKLKAV